jgi:hypothetical protein
VTLASCAIGSTVTWLYPSSTQGNPPKMAKRPYSVATQMAGDSQTARSPARATSTCSTSAKSAGKRARYATSRPAIATASGSAMPP